MKKIRPLLLLSAVLSLGFTGCVSSGTPGTGAVTTTQATLAAAVEDTVAIGLVPVLTKNDSYLGAARAVALALGSFDGATLTPADVAAFLGKTPLAPEDARTVAALVNAAWATYARRYQAQAGANLRPDVKLFLGAVSAGISHAIAAVPPTADLQPARPRFFGALGCTAIG